MAAISSVERVRAHAGRLSRWVGYGVVFLSVLLVLERFGKPVAMLVQHGPDGATLRLFAQPLIEIWPAIAYLVALGATHRALRELARGDLFGPTVTRMLARVGAMLAAGAAIALFVVPVAERLAGWNPGYWIPLDVSALTLAAMGLTLRVLAHALGRAYELKTELDEIF